MTSSIITDFWPSLHEKISDLVPDVSSADVNSGVVKYKNSLGMGLHILLRKTDFECFIMVFASKIVVEISFLVVMSTAMVIRGLGSTSTSTRMFSCFPLTFRYRCRYSCR
jgi:hypothetical protein